jgi:hypothetical protein
MTKLNGNTVPVIVIVSVLGVMATLIGVQSQEVRELSRRTSSLECGQAELRTDTKYIREAVDDIKGVMREAE